MEWLSPSSHVLSPEFSGMGGARGEYKSSDPPLFSRKSQTEKSTFTSQFIALCKSIVIRRVNQERTSTAGRILTELHSLFRTIPRRRHSQPTLRCASTEEAPWPLVPSRVWLVHPLPTPRPRPPLRLPRPHSLHNAAHHWHAPSHS